MSNEQFTVIVLLLMAILVAHIVSYVFQKETRLEAMLTAHKALRPGERVERAIVAIVFGGQVPLNLFAILAREQRLNKIVVLPDAADVQQRDHILLCDELLVVDPAGAVGPSARAAIELAKRYGKAVRYLSLERSPL